MLGSRRYQNVEVTMDGFTLLSPTFFHTSWPILDTLPYPALAEANRLWLQMMKVYATQLQCGSPRVPQTTAKLVYHYNK